LPRRSVANVPQPIRANWSHSIAKTLSFALQGGWLPNQFKLTHYPGFLFHPLGVDPNDLGTVALPAQSSFGETGLLLALGGMMFCIGGAAVDSSFSASYNLAQFLGWEWGRNRGPKKAPRFTASWLLFLFLAMLIVLSGINPVEITEYAVVFSVVALPLTYLPILLIAGDPSFMGKHANGRVSRTLGWLYFAVIVVLAVSAVPLLLATNGGGG
jgi:manganese transport protein